MNCYDTQPVIQFRLRRLKKEITNTDSKPASPRTSTRHAQPPTQHRRKEPQELLNRSQSGSSSPFSLWMLSLPYNWLFFSTDYLRRTHRELHKPFNPASKCHLLDVTFSSGLSLSFSACMSVRYGCCGSCPALHTAPRRRSEGSSSCRSAWDLIPVAAATRGAQH